MPSSSGHVCILAENEENNEIRIIKEEIREKKYEIAVNIYFIQKRIIITLMSKYSEKNRKFASKVGKRVAKKLKILNFVEGLIPINAL